jgi:uncharacterized membrane-anchored protein YjiN (DUF445 family)
MEGDVPTLPDVERRRGLARMKAVALGLLVLAAVVYVLLRRWEATGAPGWVGYARAAAEAGMIGGLADWFAVTALFRRPMGLPIPHTAIVPTRKDALGRSLGEFVGANFFAADVVRAKLRRTQPARRVGEWLSRPEHAQRVTAEVATVVRAAAGVLRDEDVQDVLEHALLQRLAATPMGPPLGRLLDQVVRDRSHDGAVDLAAEHAHAWLVANRQSVLDVVTAQAPDWSPRLVDELVALRVHSELVRVAAEVRADPYHPVRVTVDRYLRQLAEDLEHDPEMRAAADRLVAGLVDSPEVRRVFTAMLASARRLLLELVDDPGSELRTRLAEALRAFGSRLTEDADLRAKLDGWLETAVEHVVVTYRGELTTLITDTVESWDAEGTSRRIELQVGRDLQFIRVNGTVVGALAGIAIHGVSQLLV